MLNIEFLIKSNKISKNYSNKLLQIIMDLLDDMPEGGLKEKYKTQVETCQTEILKQVDNLDNDFYLQKIKKGSV